MKRLSLAVACAALIASPAFAGGKHKDGHGHNNAGKHGKEMMAVGKPGKSADVSRNIEVAMMETDDGDMIFEPAVINVSQGQTIRFEVRNVGEIDHEFVFGDHKSISRHKKVMEEADEMHHHDNPNAIRLGPGGRGDVVWSFTNSGIFEFACLIPGHYEAGMKGKLKVTAKQISSTW